MNKTRYLLVVALTIAVLLSGYFALRRSSTLRHMDDPVAFRMETARYIEREVDPRVVIAQNAFSLRMLQQCARQDDGRNVFISPLSIATGLTMLCHGARGETQTELRRVLGIDGRIADQWDRTSHAIIRVLSADDPYRRYRSTNPTLCFQ